jgi:hypothetical protein
MIGIYNEHNGVNHEAIMLFPSQVCASSTLLLETVKNLRWLPWHDIYTKFCINQSKLKEGRVACT